MIRKSNDLVGSLLHDVAHRLRLRIDARLKPWRLTRQKWLALGQVRDHPDMTQAELAGRLELGAAATGRLIDRMVARGFIRRRSDSSDRRAYRLRITPAAEETLAQLQDEGDEIRAEVLKGLTKAEVETLERALQKVKENLVALSRGALVAALPWLAQAATLPIAGGHHVLA